MKVNSYGTSGSGSETSCNLLSINVHEIKRCLLKMVLFAYSNKQLRKQIFHYISITASLLRVVWTFVWCVHIYENVYTGTFTCKYVSFCYCLFFLLNFLLLEDVSSSCKSSSSAHCMVGSVMTCPFPWLPQQWGEVSVRDQFTSPDGHCHQREDMMPINLR